MRGVVHASAGAHRPESDTVVARCAASHAEKVPILSSVAGLLCSVYSDTTEHAPLVHRLLLEFFTREVGL